MSTGRLIQTEEALALLVLLGAAWLNERLWVPVVTTGLERRSCDDVLKCRVGMQLYWLQEVVLPVDRILNASVFNFVFNTVFDQQPV